MGKMTCWSDSRASVVAIYRFHSLLTTCQLVDHLIPIVDVCHAASKNSINYLIVFYSPPPLLYRPSAFPLAVLLHHDPLSLNYQQLIIPLVAVNRLPRFHLPLTNRTQVEYNLNPAPMQYSSTETGSAGTSDTSQLRSHRTWHNLSTLLWAAQFPGTYYDE